MDGAAGGQRTGLLTLVFTDIVESTQLKQALGDREGAAVIQQHRALVRELLRGFAEGQEIETAGDSFLLVFSKPSDAVRFALELRHRQGGLAASGGPRVLLRMGIHLGEVVVEEHAAGQKARDLYGTPIDTCARVMSLAKGNQVLMSRGVFDSARQLLKGGDLEGIGPLEWLNHGPYLLKGLEEAVEICEVRPAGQAEAPGPPTSSEKAQRQVRAEEEPVLGWRPAVGQAVAKTQWVLERKLGEGGFGEVWLGRHQTMKERRVFKFCFRVDRVRSLKREMTLFRLLKERVGEHPNIVSLREVSFDEAPYYVEMDFVEGSDLRGWCEQVGGWTGFPLETRLEIVAQAADGLAAAHAAGVLHRDIKPANVLVTSARPPSGPARVLAKLSDFGIGQVISQEYLADVTRLGFTQTMLSSASSSQTGTQLYMAPELIAGQPASVGSDIYSLGIILYQLIRGDLACPLTTDWARHIQDPFLRADLERCFAGDPKERFASAADLAGNLRGLEQRRAAQAARIAAAKRRKLRAAAAIAASVVLLPLLWMAAAKAWDARQARVLVRNLGAAYTSFSTYQATTLMEQEVSVAGASQKVTLSTMLRFARPNKMHLSLKSASQELQVVCDGKTMWVAYVLGPYKQYTEQPAPRFLAPAILNAFADDPTVWGMRYVISLPLIFATGDPQAWFQTNASPIKIIGSEPVNGQPAIAVEWPEADSVPVARWDESRTNAPRFVLATRAWIGKKAGDILRIRKDVIESLKVVADQASLGGGEAQLKSMTRFQITETLSDLRANETLPDSVFTFTPPAGAVKVDRFTIWRRAADLPDQPAPTRPKAELAKLIPARSPSADAALLDLSEYFNESLSGFVTEAKDNTLASLPQGLQKLGGVEFDVRGAVYLPGRRARLHYAFPEAIRGIQVGRKVQVVHVLHGSHLVPMSQGTQLARYVLRYAGGEQRELPVRYGEHLVDWWKTGDNPPGLTPAWTGANPAATARGASIQVFKSSYTNPLPAVVVESLDLVSNLKAASAFVLAITVE